MKNHLKINYKRDDIMLALEIGGAALVWFAFSLGTLELIHLSGII